MKIRVQFEAQLPVKLIRRKKWVVASCPILDVHSQGETDAKAKANLREALTLFFISCFERGTLDSVLKQCGFQAIRPSGKQPAKKIVASREEFIKVPIPFIVDQSSRASCHA